MIKKKVYIGADHRGFNLKEQVDTWFDAWEYEHEDVGALTYDKDDDYTKYAEALARKVARDKDSLGILMCGSGVGVDVVANKIDGVRASIGKNEDQIKAGRKDDNMNVLVLAADHTSLGEARRMLKAFLETRYDHAERHEKRLKDIKEIEKDN